MIDDPERRARVRALSESTLDVVAPYLHDDPELGADLAVLIISRLPIDARRATLRRAVDELVEIETKAPKRTARME